MNFENLFWTIVVIILLVIVLILPASRTFLVDMYTAIGDFNTSFFGQLPYWFKWGSIGIVFSSLLYFAYGFKK